MDDRFIVISEHNEDELFIHPTFPQLERSERRIIVTVTFGEGRAVEKKRKLAELITRQGHSVLPMWLDLSTPA